MVIEFDFFFVPPAEIARLEHLRVPMLPVFDLHVSQGRNIKFKLFQNGNQRKRQQQMQVAESFHLLPIDTKYNFRLQGT